MIEIIIIKVNNFIYIIFKIFEDIQSLNLLILSHLNIEEKLEE